LRDYTTRNGYCILYINEIAAASGSKVWFYYPKSAPQQKLRWELEFQEEHPCEISCLDWGSNGQLIIGGFTLGLYEIKLINSNHRLLSIFSVEPPFLPEKCQFSPCSKFFALYSRKQKHIMVWYRRKVELIV
jgi:hypothetical protein